MKFLKWFFLVFFLFVLLVVFLFLWGINTMEKRVSFSKEKEVFEQKGIPIEASRYSTKSGDVFYVKVG